MPPVGSPLSPYSHLSWRISIQLLVLWKSSPAYDEGVIIGTFLNFISVFKQWLLWGHAEAQKKAVSTGKLICLLCDNSASFHMPDVWGRVRSRLQMVMAESYYLGAQVMGKAYSSKLASMSVPWLFLQPHVSQSSTIHQIWGNIWIFCLKTLILYCYGSPEDKRTHLTEERAGDLRLLLPLIKGERKRKTLKYCVMF